MNTVTNVRLTTAVKSNASLYKQVEDAFSILSALDLVNHINVINRKKLTIRQLFQRDTTPLIVFESNGPKLYFTAETPIYFHLDTVKVKLQLMKQNKQPVLVEMVDYVAKDLPSFNFVDGTMGFGRDSYLILKTFKQATIYAIEQHPLIHYVISEGMKRYLDEETYKRIHFINDDYNKWVKRHPEVVDLLYLDNMFERTLDENDRMGELSKMTETDQEIVSVSDYKYLIVKAHYKSPTFKNLKVTQCIRKSTKTHYGLKINHKRLGHQYSAKLK
ncbi:class I SAM-dependent methyltransferase [Mammaliicoccus vitulinus]|uniref:class I SAM-dependent methyltransferase n=1 Tax=Mammaliicoccus vitulinus TaxID=71237 RepID=UPI00145B0FF8|nr:class I SAM-dependent methyltransferase [Mammaliicoccus vitulinus]QJF25110.1 class I SAM-dependent methyltransferase [Mammaliicoccus vitulinus]